MKNLIITSILVLIVSSCKDDDPDCCASLPGMLSLHVSNIEGVGTSEKERKDFLSKVSIYYFSKTGVKIPVPLTGTQDQAETYTEFSEVKKLFLKNGCQFNVENCLSVGAFPLETVRKKKIERLYLQIRQDVDTIDLDVRYIPEGFVKHVITDMRVNEKSRSPVRPAEGGPSYHYHYYFSKTGKKPKITCLSE